MLIKHYLLCGTLCVIDNVKDVWVHPEDKPTISRENDYFAYAEEDAIAPQKVISFQKDGEPKVLRINEGITAYICNDEGKTIDKVTMN